MMKQASYLQRKPHVIVATPGRLIDHLRSASAPALHRLRFLVLDEADRLLDTSGFPTEIAEIISYLPTQRQTLLFSATISHSIRKMLTFSSPPYCYRSKSRMYVTRD
jgi:superfamily II DNA/RNA helicase